MSIISEVKCARCDRKYSGVRSRCPYCGARRIGRGKYSEEEDNSKGKMWIGILVMAVLVVAAGILLFSTPAQGDEDPGDSIQSPPTNTNMPDEGENTTLPGDPVEESPDPSPDVSPPPAQPATPEVRALTITYSGRARTDITVRVAEKVPLSVKIDPFGADGEIFWESSNTSVFDFVKVDEDGRQILLTGTGIGNATLTVTVDGVKAECIVRGRAPR